MPLFCFTHRTSKVQSAHNVLRAPVASNAAIRLRLGQQIWRCYNDLCTVCHLAARFTPFPTDIAARHGASMHFSRLTSHAVDEDTEGSALLPCAQPSVMRLYSACEILGVACPNAVAFLKLLSARANKLVKSVYCTVD